MILNFKSSNITSAPVSPHSTATNVTNVPSARGVSGLLSRATSLTGSNIVTNTVQQIARAATSQVAAVIKDRHKILLIIDDHLVDWSKYFRGRRLIGDWDIKVEQAEFKDINLSSDSELGALVTIYTVDRNGFRIARTFRPDFVLIRQHIQQDGNQNYSDIIVGLKYGLIPSINSLQSFYNFQDKAWVFANLLAIQRKQGKESFPLIEQTFFQKYKDSSGVPKLPCVVKIGSSSSGLGKVKVENINQYQDIRSVLMITNKYCTIEPFIDAKCDFNLQKIGTNYKAFTRKSVSGNWKANIGSALLEPIPFNDRYRKWIDDVSDLFGGLDICSLEGVIGKDGREFIFKVRGSDMALLGDTQEEDRKNIVELIIQRMNAICKNILIKQQSRASISANEPESIEQQSKRSSITSMNQPTSAAVPPPIMNRRSSKDSSFPPSSGNRPLPPKPPPPTSSSFAANPPSKPPPPPPPPSSSSTHSSNTVPSSVATTTSTTKTINENPTNPFASSFNPNAINNDENEQMTKQPPPLNKRDSQTTIGEIKEEVDDTMRNLRKTFAGIFGDM
ncbi:Asparaginyl-tRNA synthetase, cytoplasmic (Asparagine--tRNA ligase) (AsnRS) [Dermatophagoides farinae]|nr:Asparaginyl-tRNA synthetase, cytoplasmic (Asparagine--tRNA ligase) (AsnRS) [Dermatophagoides farinae]